MFESSNDVNRQAVYILDSPITMPASLTMTTFAALHTTNINIPKINCVGGAPFFTESDTTMEGNIRVDDAFIDPKITRCIRLREAVEEASDPAFNTCLDALFKAKRNL
ncbi:hypothetical protein CEXT_148651 [Caerostris extrusa]|uniref:Uncharacterized protein n=1 Tax=Caerostris extrusa TaxID=172846 RepID=A0AAV4USI4_CAEEX|nr:hypothetical protein CEXT_148651 [Caerostris extrusa]